MSYLGLMRECQCFGDNNVLLTDCIQYVVY